MVITTAGGKIDNKINWTCTIDYNKKVAGSDPGDGEFQKRLTCRARESQGEKKKKKKKNRTENPCCCCFFFCFARSHPHGPERARCVSAKVWRHP